MTPKTSAELAVERVRLFFPLPAEETIAMALTKFWASRAGEKIEQLHPELSMGEILDLAQDHSWTTPEFAQMLELADLEAFDEQLEQMTFREFVRYAASKRS